MIGFRPDQDSDGPQDMPEELQKSSTGLTVDQCHELLTIATFESTFSQTLGEKFWIYLTRTRDDAIRSLLNTLDTRLTESGLTAKLLGPVTHPLPMASGTVILKTPGRRLGLVFTPTQTDVVLNILRLKLFTLGILPAPITLLLEMEGYPEPLATITLRSNEWQDVELPPLRKGSVYYLTYAEDDLGTALAQNSLAGWPAIKKNCKSCKQKCLAHYLESKAIAFYANGNGEESTVTNYGLNVAMTADGDVTGRFIDNPKRLLSALKQQTAVTFLEKIAYSTRKNPETEDARQGALFALTDKDNANRVPVLLDRAVSAIVKALQEEASSGIDVNDFDDVTWDSI